MKLGHLDFPEENLRTFCNKWKVQELSVFGSVLNDDFSADSDIDILVSFAPGGAMTFEGFIAMRQELSALFGDRQVDLVEKRLVRNPFRRQEILATRKVVYAA